jgi:hypothetical protein
MLEKKVKRAQRVQHISVWKIADASQKLEYIGEEKEQSDWELGQLELELDRWKNSQRKKIKKNKVISENLK